jgi:hypothetical protein
MFQIVGVGYEPLAEEDFDDGLEMEDDSQVLLSHLLPKACMRTRTEQLRRLMARRS